MSVSSGTDVGHGRHAWESAPTGRFSAAPIAWLPIGIHAGSSYHNPPTSVGGLLSIEDYVAQAQAFQTQLTQLDRRRRVRTHPGLKMVMLESGFHWLRLILALHKFWRGIRMERHGGSPPA